MKIRRKQIALALGGLSQLYKIKIITEYGKENKK